MTCRISVPRPGIEPRPWQWKPGILTTRPPGNSLPDNCVYLGRLLSSFQPTPHLLRNHWAESTAMSSTFYICGITHYRGKIWHKRVRSSWILSGGQWILGKELEWLGQGLISLKRRGVYNWERSNDLIAFVHTNSTSWTRVYEVWEKKQPVSEKASGKCCPRERSRSTIFIIWGGQGKFSVKMFEMQDSISTVKQGWGHRGNVWMGVRL